MRKLLVIGIAVGMMLHRAAASPPAGVYENSLVITPLYAEYAEDSEDKFAREAEMLKSQLGTAPYVKLGFAAFMVPAFPDVPLDRPLVEDDFAADLEKIDLLVSRARRNGIVNHVSLISGFFHGQSPMRLSAIRQDVRNAQWFADGWIGDPTQLKTPDSLSNAVWVTPSRYAEPLHSRVEEGFRILARRFASLMKQFPDTLMTISGDGEVELTFERNFNSDGTRPDDTKELIYPDYSPFMVAEFRDWLRGGRYDRDLSPASDDDGDGHTFNRDFGQNFTSWKLRYYDDSGPIPLTDYLQLPEKLPTTGPYAFPGGYDAPRKEAPGDAFWEAWIRFRQHVVGDWVSDFATWMTTSPDPNSGFTIPGSRVYSHQIPADYIFGQSENTRLKTSASPIATAVTEPVGSTGVTAFNGYDGKKHVKTATPPLFSALFMTSDNWGILEYNPSVPYSNSIPPSSDERYYLSELRTVYDFRPHLLIPFLWSDDPVHKAGNIKGSAFARALHTFISEVGKNPWFSWRAVTK